MRLSRILFGLVLVATGGIAATAAGFEMLLCAAYGAWGLAFAYCMGTALASMVLCTGGYVLLGRLPACMVYTPPGATTVAPTSRPPRPPAPGRE